LLVFFLLTFVISWSYETASILTGFPFGHYDYTDKLGSKLWLVPLLIMPAYFSMGYLAWTLAHVLLDRFDDRLAGTDVVLVPVLASFVMVMWDLCIEPGSSTIAGAWIWRWRRLFRRAAQQFPRLVPLRLHHLLGVCALSAAFA
jgi:putative membrane protein